VRCRYGCCQLTDSLLFDFGQEDCGCLIQNDLPFCAEK
jgi:hypothetical protein